MTDHLDLDTRLSRLLGEEAPPRAPERLIHATRDRVAGTPQRGALRGLRWRLRSPATALIAPAIGVVGVALVVAALGLSDRLAPSIAAIPSATVAPRASVSPPPSTSPSAPFTCPAVLGTCLGTLQPGRHTSTSFVPTVSYTVPAGWTNTMDNRGQLDLQWSTGGQYLYPDGLVFHDGISIFRRPVAMSSARQVPAAGVGRTASDLTRWLAAHVDLDASAPQTVTIGGRTAHRLVLSVPVGPRTTPDHCTTDHGEPRCVSLFLSDEQGSNFGFGLVGPEIAVVYLLDLPSGDTVMVVIDDADGIDQPALEAAALPIVNSLAFSP